MVIEVEKSYFKKEWDDEISFVTIVEIVFGDIVYRYPDGLAFKEDSRIFEASLIGEALLH